MTKSSQKDIPYKPKRLREIINILRKNGIIHGLSPEKLRNILEELGPTYVKLGQIMSMRQDMFPAEYCLELTKLRAGVKPMPFSEVREIIEREYGVPYKTYFREIDSEALGSASIAQAHKAQLKDGRKVVIKVQRSNIREIMAQDIILLKKAVSLLKLVSDAGNVIDFKMVLDEMWSVAQQEMDFLLEAEHINEFERLNLDIAYIGNPKVEKELSTSKILVMEYIDGIPIDNTEKLNELGYDMKEIGTKLAENYVKQILDDAYFHADPHPGNIWIRDGKIIWLDFGMMGKISSRDKQIFRSVVHAVVNNDVYELKNAFLTIGIVKGKINHVSLYADIDDLLTRYGNMDLGNMNLGHAFQDLMELANRHNVSMPQGIAMLGRGIMTVEGVLSLCSPETNFIEIMSNHLSGGIFENIDVNHELKKAGKNLYSTLNKSIEIPAQLSDFLKMTIKGQTKLNLELTGSEEPLKKIDKMVNRLVLSIVITALIIGSSLVCTSGLEPVLFGLPFISLAGYAASALLSICLLINIFKKK